MTGEEAAKAIEFLRASWPQANRWPEDTWLFWTDLFMAHGRSYVRTAFKRLMRDPAFREFPPGLAAFTQEFEVLEGHLRDRIRYAEEALSVAQEQEDEERAEQITVFLERAEERLSR